MIQTKIFQMFLKALFMNPKMIELFDYKDKPNELDLAVEELQKFRKDDKVKLNAALDLFKSATESVDKLSGKVKSIDKVIDKFDDKLQQIGKIAHPPAIPLKEINEFRETNKNVKWIMSMFKLMKKNPLLKSMFK